VLLRLLPKLKRLERGAGLLGRTPSLSSSFCSLVPGHTVSPAPLTATTARVNNALRMLCQQSHGTLADHAPHRMPHTASDELAPVSESVLYSTALTSSVLGIENYT
jgi:hypothetical protein